MPFRCLSTAARDPQNYNFEVPINSDKIFFGIFPIFYFKAGKYWKKKIIRKVFI